MFPIIQANNFQLPAYLPDIDGETTSAVTQIIEAVRVGGESALRQFGQKFNEISSEQPLILSSDELQAACTRIPIEYRELLTRVKDRIEHFARAQVAALSPIEIEVPGGTAGHTIVPIERVGCYVPAGYFSLPSTALMTCTTARVAGCRYVLVASPKPTDLMLAAAAIAGADEMLVVGGAHAIAAMAYGIPELAPLDLIVGPGNRFVTEAKRQVFGRVGIDMLAGPSELLVVADNSADPAKVAADLLAQAEHDPDARPFVASTERTTLEAIQLELGKQLQDLPTAETATRALQNGAAIICADREELLTLCNRIAPEHLELTIRNADEFAKDVKHAGCIFIGGNSAEVFGDYGIGPNHTLPTNGSARFTGGLNVFTFARVRTWIKMSDYVDADLISDTKKMAEIEGLEAHRRAAAIRDYSPQVRSPKG